ncbi:MAG: SurA N-terminal domain-containing protein [bacterium]
MLQWIRDNRRVAQVILVLLIFPFACTGIEQYRRSHSDTEIVARVGDQKITQAEFDEALRTRLDQLRNMMGPSFDPAIFDTPKSRQALLDQLINERAVLVGAQEAKLVITNEQLREFIMSVPNFQKNGKFDPELYQKFLMSQRKTEAEFDAILRRDLMAQKMLDGPANSALAPASVVTKLQQALLEQRSVQGLVFSPDNYLAKVNPSDQQITDYYEKNKNKFELPEQVDVEYLVLSQETLAKGINVSAADVKAYYEQNQARYKSEEQRRASHILIALGEDKAKAKAKAEQLLAQVKAKPDQFAELARQYSDDPVSKEKGGDLEFFGKGMMVPQFEQAVFAMKQGDIRGLVESEFGFHIIRLTAIKPANIQSLEQARTDAENELRRQQAAKRYTEVAATFTEVVFEQADSLTPAATKFGLSLQKVAGVTRSGNASESPVTHPKVRQALFSDDVLKNKRNTATIEVASNTLVAARVVRYQAATVQPLAQVKAAVVQGAKLELALQQAKLEGAAKLKALQASGKAEGLGAELKVSRQSPSGLNPDALRAILKVNGARLPAVVGVDLGPAGYGVYRINQISQREDVSAAVREQAKAQYASVLSQAETAAMVEALKTRLQTKTVKPMETGTK